MATITTLLTESGVGTFIKPANVTQIQVECWGGGGGGGCGSGATNGGGAGGQYASSLLNYSIGTQSISYTVAQRVLGIAYCGSSCTYRPNGDDTTWGNNVVVAKGGQGGFSTSNGTGSLVGGIGDIVYKGGDGFPGSSFDYGARGSGGGGANSTGNGNNATSTAGGAYQPNVGGFCVIPVCGGEGGIGQASSGTGGGGKTWGGGGGGCATLNVSQPTNVRGGFGEQGLIRLTYDTIESNIIEWQGNHLLIEYLDNATSYSTAIDGSQMVRTENGTEYSWIPNSNYILEVDARWIPTTSTATQTGWDGATGWRAFLEYARAKNPFKFYIQSTGLTVDSYLVEPLNGEHSLEPDGTRRIRLVIRNTTTPYTGF